MSIVCPDLKVGGGGVLWENASLFLLILYHCLNGWGGPVTRNKSTWIFCPHAAFVVLGERGPPCLQDSLGPRVVVDGHAPVVGGRAGACQRPTASGVSIGP